MQIQNISPCYSPYYIKRDHVLDFVQEIALKLRKPKNKKRVNEEKRKTDIIHTDVYKKRKERVHSD